MKHNLFNLKSALIITISCISIDAFSQGQGGGQGAGNSWTVDGNLLYNVTAHKVGIGTSSPQKLLHLKTEHNVLTLPEGEDQGSHMGLRIEDNLLQSSDGSVLRSSIWDFEPITSEISSLEIGKHGEFTVMTLLKDGRVGVGTKTPAELLEVAGKIKATGGIFSGDIKTTHNLAVDGNIKVGTNSLFLGKPDASTNNSIWSNDGHLWLQSNPAYSSNTIINSGNSGHTGIGTPNPVEKLQIYNDRSITFGHTTNYDLIGEYIGFNAIVNQTPGAHSSIKKLPSVTNTQNGGAILATNYYGDVHIQTFLAPAGYDNQSVIFDYHPQFQFLHDGSFRINATKNTYSASDATIVTNFLVTNEGHVKARSIKVSMESFSDYVFADDYKLRPLSEVEEYIKANKHLPGISSQTEYQKDGADLGDLAKVQMEKIEELTLYIIELEKRLSALEKK